MGKAELILECRKCKAGFDVSEMKPDARFRCENCGAWLRVPRPSRRGPIIAVVSGLAIVATVVIVYFVSTGGGPEPDKTPPREAARGEPEKGKTPESPEEAPKELDLVAMEFENFKKQADSGRIRDILAFARYCREHHERYASEAEKAYRTVLNEDPEHEEALKNLGLACLEDLHVPRKWYDDLVKSPWFKNARGVLDKEVKSKQDLRDIGLTYAYAPPFVLVHERSQSETEDRLCRRKAAAILQGLAGAFNSLIGKQLGVDATEVTAVIPVFWFRTERAVSAYRESRPPDLLEMNSADFHRNPHWCFCNEEDITRLTLSPLASEAAEKLVTLATKKPKAKPLPRWVVLGLAGQLARIKCVERKFDTPAVTYLAPDPGTLRSTTRAKDRTKLEGVVASSVQRAKILEQLKKFFKERGITNVDINAYVGDDFVNPRDAWALVDFFLRGEPENRKRFLDYLERVQKGEVPVKAFHAAFAPEGEKKADLEKLDAAWLEWMKGEAKTATGEEEEGGEKKKG